MALFVLLIFIVSPLLSLSVFLYGIISDKKHIKTYLIIIVLYFCKMAYIFQPKNETDLTRYYLQLENYKLMPFTTMLWYSINNGVQIGKDFYFWIVSQSNKPQLLQVFPVFITYTVSIYIVYDYFKRNKNMLSFNNFLISILVFISIVPFSTVVNNVRNVTAFSIALLSIYLKMRGTIKKSTFLILAFISTSFHTTGIILFILFFLSQKLKKTTIKNHRHILFLAVFVSFMLKYLTPYLDGFGYSEGMLSNFIYTVNAHFNHSSELEIYYSTSLGAKLRKYFYILILVFFYLHLIYIKTTYRRISLKEKNSIHIEEMRMFTFLQYILTLGFLSLTLESNIYMRFVILAFQVLPLYIMVLEKNNLIKRKAKFKFLILSVSIIGLIVDLFYMSRMVDLAEYYLRVLI